ncbi:MAG: hypothetical protein Q9162_004990 [Coniocarpon cinnabarinum]
MSGARPAGRVPPSSAPLPPNWEKDLTEQFRQKLSTKRMAELSRRSSSRHPHSRSPRRDIASRPPSVRLPPRHGSTNPQLQPSPASIDDFSLGTQPQTYSSLRNIPLIPAPPSDSQSHRFRNELHMLSETPCKWENPGLLDEAMTLIPLERIYSEATEESQMLQATAESMGKRPAWSYQDCCIRALMRWFKNTWFTWVNNPPCGRCGSPTISKGNVAPTQDEKARSGNRVELYQCSLTECSQLERFPRYNDAFVLMHTRRGRLGEWTNCFSMFCRAMGARVRWVWNSEDHVWTEVYSEYRRRWVHVDPCEAQFDKPLLYSEGWNKKISYCIAFSNDGAMDVTRRYCRNFMKYAGERKRTSESALLFVLDEIRRMRRRDMSKDDKFKLEEEDMREMRELRHYYFSTLTSSLAKSYSPASTPRMTPSEAADAAKAAESRVRDSPSLQPQTRDARQPREQERRDRTPREERRDHPPQ